MAYIDIYAAATVADHVLRQQTAVALHKAAVDILNESAATEDHAQRMAWARRVLADPVGWSERAIWKVLENATIQSAPAEATDNDVQFVVNSLVNALSKAT
ncbi:MAG: hypothetical protein ACOY3P_03490 [Planctomycetota bacterium]